MSVNDYVLAVDIGGTSIKMGVVSNCDIIDTNTIRNSFKGHFEDM